MLSEIELAVIGAGPAGIEAAVTAARAGVSVLLVDSAPRPGGQYFKQIPDSFQSDDRTAHQAHATRLFKQLETSGVEVLLNTLVWGIFEGQRAETWCLTLHGLDAPQRVTARAVILANGAYDRSIAFPGWDLPGVITAGAALTMIKTQGVLPGKQVVLSGTGPLLLAAAAYLVQAGASVVGVCESAVGLPGRGLKYLPAVWGQWGRMKEGLGYLKTLTEARVPYRLGWAVTSAEGEERVCGARLAKLDRSSRAIGSSQITVEVDTVIDGYSLTPGTELARLADCELIYVAARGGYVPVRNKELETSRPGIYAAGDCAGIGGAELARIEGRIAGYAAAARLGYMTRQGAQDAAAAENKALQREQRFARVIGDLFSPEAGLFALADADTIICRCEQVTLGQIRAAAQAGAQSVSDIKNLVRAGMGNCQGRTCESLVAHILAAETGKKLEEVQYFHTRPPVHPLPLEIIAEYTGAEPEAAREEAQP